MLTVVWGYALVFVAALIVYAITVGAVINWRHRRLKPQAPLLTDSERRRLERDGIELFCRRLELDREQHARFLAELHREPFIYARAIQRSTGTPTQLERYIAPLVGEFDDAKLIEFNETLQQDSALTDIAARSARYQTLDRKCTRSQLAVVATCAVLLVIVLAFPHWQRIHKHRTRTMHGPETVTVLSREAIGYRSLYRMLMVDAEADRIVIRPKTSLQRSEADLYQTRPDLIVAMKQSGLLTLIATALLICLRPARLKQPIASATPSRVAAPSHEALPAIPS